MPSDSTGRASRHKAHSPQKISSTSFFVLANWSADTKLWSLLRGCPKQSGYRLSARPSNSLRQACSLGPIGHGRIRRGTRSSTAPWRPGPWRRAARALPDKTSTHSVAAAYRTRADRVRGRAAGRARPGGRHRWLGAGAGQPRRCRGGADPRKRGCQRGKSRGQEMGVQRGSPKPNAPTCGPQGQVGASASRQQRIERMVRRKAVARGLSG